MQSQSIRAKDSDALHPPPHAQPITLGGNVPRALRQHRDLSRAVVHLVKLVRDERKAKGAGNDTVYRNGAILVATGSLLQLRDTRAPQRTRRREGDQCDSEES